MKKKYISILLVVVGIISLSYLFLAKEKTIDDCWQVINEIVYDFTPYIESVDHPGGKAMAKDCGTDLTFRYENDPKYSEYVESLLPQYAIGKLVVNE